MKIESEHKCSRKYLCFSKNCRIGTCDECIDEHIEHQQFIVEKETLIQQLVKSKNKYYTFTDKMIADMKQSLMYAASLFTFDIDYINNMIKLFLDYEDQPQKRAQFSEEVENFLLGSYQSRVGLNEIFIENVNLKHFVDPIKESFQSISKNYLEFYKSMRNMEMFKVNLKTIVPKMFNDRLYKSCYQQEKDKNKCYNVKMTDKIELVQSGIQKGMRVQDIVEKYNISASTVSKYLKMMNRNDEDMKNFKYSDEYKELQNLFNEDDQIEIQLKEAKEKEEAEKKSANEANQKPEKKKKGRKSKKEILEMVNAVKKKFCSDNGSGNSSDSIKLTKKEEKIINKEQDKLTQTKQKDVPSQNQSKIVQPVQVQSNVGENKTNNQSVIQLDKHPKPIVNLNDKYNSPNQKGNLSEVTPSPSSKQSSPQNQLDSSQSTPENNKINNQLENRANPLLKLREQADKVKLSHHMFPFYYMQRPAIGITFKNQLNFFSIDGQSIQFGQYKIEQSLLYQDNFIKDITIMQSRLLARDVIFIQSMNNMLFFIDSKNQQLQYLLNGIECFDYFKGFKDNKETVGIIAKQGSNIVRYIYHVKKDQQINKLYEDPRVLCQVNPVEFLEFSKLTIFVCGSTKYMSFLCKNGLYIYKQDQFDQRYNQQFFIKEPGIIFTKMNPKNFGGEDAKYNLFALSNNQLIMYSALYNQYETINIQKVGDTVRDFVVSYNRKLNKEFVVIAYSRNIIVIVDKKLAKIDISTESDIKSIQVFWADSTMQLCYQTVQDEAMKFNIDYFEF